VADKTRGWFEETYTLTGGTQALAVRPFSLQMSRAGVEQFEIEVSGADMLRTEVGAITMAVTTGTAGSTSAKPRMLVSTDSTGLITMAVTDVGGGGITLNVQARPVSFSGPTVNLDFVVA